MLRPLSILNRNSPAKLSHIIPSPTNVTCTLPAKSRAMTTSNNNNKVPFIISFYSPSIQAQDASGRSLTQILQFNDTQLERHHDYIQYLFPLPERSPVNPRAPVITKEVREAFLKEAELRQQLRQSLDRMLGFYGFAPASSAGKDSAQDEAKPESHQIDISPGDHFESNSKQTWRKRFDHNHLRITRIIRSLRVLGLEDEARAFHQALRENDDGRVSRQSFVFWQRAAERALHLSPEEDEGDEGRGWLRG